MNDITPRRTDGLDRNGLIAWMKEAIDRAESLSRNAFDRRHISLAETTVEILVDEPLLAERYFNRLISGEPSSVGNLDRLYVLTGTTSHFRVPLWEDQGCSARAFQAIVTPENFRAAFPLVPRFWQFFDCARRIGIQLAQSPTRLPKWDASAPLRRHLHWLLEERGHRLVHAATLGWRARGLLLLGKGGSGKSGTTLAGLAAGLSTVGDDYVVLEGGSTPSVHPLYRILKQDGVGLGRLPGLSEKLAGLPPNWQGKIEFDPDAIFPGAIAERLGLVAVMLPRIARRPRPLIVPVASSTAMLALMSTNLHQHIGEPERGISFFASILRRLPCFRIDLSNDAIANGAHLREFLETLPG